MLRAYTGGMVAEYANVLVPHKFHNGNESFSARLFCEDDDDYTRCCIREAIHYADSYGMKYKKDYFNLDPYEERFVDGKYINVYAPVQEPPEVYGVDGRKLSADVEKDVDEIRSGDMVCACIEFFPYTVPTKDKRGIKCKLLAVQKVTPSMISALKSNTSMMASTSGMSSLLDSAF